MASVTTLPCRWSCAQAGRLLTRRPQVRSPSTRPPQHIRCASRTSKPKAEDEAPAPVPKKKKKANMDYKQWDLRQADQFTLCDAIRYIRAFEVGQAPTSAKYELHVRFRTAKNGPIVRNRIRLPHPVKTDLRICVICPPDSKPAEAARSAGVAVIGEETVFEAVKAGRIEFDRCICHVDSLQKLNKAGVARILGPRGLMPSAKFGTVVGDVAGLAKEMVGASEYRERDAVVRLAIGQLGFSPEELQQNIRSFMAQIKKEMTSLSHRVTKDIHEVVLSSTRSPGFSLNGKFSSVNSPSTEELSTL